MMRLAGSASPEAVSAFAALGHRLVGQADEDEGHRTGSDLHLNIDRPRFDPLERDRCHPRNHAFPRRLAANLAGGGARR